MIQISKVSGKIINVSFKNSWFYFTIRCCWRDSYQWKTIWSTNTSAACYIMVHHVEGICVQRSTCVLFSTKRRENFPISQKSTPKIFWWGRTRSTHYTKAKIMIKNWHHWHFHICTVLHLIECKLKYVKKNLWKYASLNFCCCLMFLRVFLGYF